MKRFNSVVLDVDSTLSGIEGIDWLAALRGPDAEARSAELTDKAMQGVIPLEAVYGQRLSAVRPTSAEVQRLSEAYVARIATGAREALGALTSAGVVVTIVSGGFQQAILPLASILGVSAGNVHAVELYFDHRGNYAGYDDRSPLTRQSGKRETIEGLSLQHPALAVGDGMTDFEISEVVEAFAAFTGFVRREAVVARADYIIEDFDQLRELVLA